MEEKLPWLPIPRFPQIGQPFAFADREDQIAELYAMIVDAGNALVAGQRPSPVKRRQNLQAAVDAFRSALTVLTREAYPEASLTAMGPPSEPPPANDSPLPAGGAPPQLNAPPPAGDLSPRTLFDTAPPPRPR